MINFIKIIFLTLLLYTLQTFYPPHTYAQLVSDFRVNDDTTSRTQYSAKLAVDNFGNFTIVWQDQRTNRPNVYCQRFDSNANFLGNNFRANINPDSSGLPSVAITESGKIGICWLEINSSLPNTSKIKFRLFNNDGTPLTGEKSVNDSIGNFTGSNSIAKINNNEFIISWNQKGILYQRIDSIGNKIGNNVLVNDNTVFAGQGAPAITVRKDNSYIITWDDTRPPAGSDANDIYFQMFDRFGNRMGSNQKVNDDSSVFNLQLVPKISSDSSDKFVIAWYDNRINNSHGEIYAQKFMSDGSKSGFNFRVSESSSSFSKGICNVFKKGNGEFLIGWTESRPFISSPYFQRYDSSGIIIGNNFLVSNQVPGINKIYSDLIIFNNKIISVWNDERNDPFDVYCNVRSFSNPDTIVSITNTSTFAPENFALYQNYPNPFNPTTKIKYEIPNSEIVKIRIYDLLGRVVSTLVNEFKESGSYEAVFNGSTFSSGIYFYKLEAGDFKQVKRMVLVK